MRTKMLLGGIAAVAVLLTQAASSNLLLYSGTSAPPATVQEDAFTDAGAPLNLTSHTPTISGTWALVTGNAGAIVIHDSGYAGQPGLGTDTLVSAIDTPSTDQVVEVVYGTSTGSPQQRITLAMRFVNIDNMLAVVLNYSSDGEILVGDITSGAFGSLVTCTPPITTGHTYRVELSGAAVTVKDNGSTVSGCNFTSAYTTGTHVGMRTFSSENQAYDLISHWKSGSGF